MKIDQVQLDNELNTLFIHSPGCSAGTVQMWFRAGSALEKHDNQGIAHFLEHMFFKGTPKRPGPQLAHDIESYGGEVNAFTSFDYTCYYINTPSLFLDKSVDILLDMVANPLFGQEDIPSERQVVFEEYRRAMDNPSQYNFMQLQKASFENGYAHPILGREDTILNFSQDQVKSFREQFYNLENALLVVAGDLKDRAELEKKIRSFRLPHGQKSEFGPFTIKEKESVNVHDKDIRQATLTLCLQSPNYNHERAAAEDLAINCLAHGETSRFYQALVAKTSLCNGVAGSTMYFANGGVHMIKMNFPVENLPKVAKLFMSTLTDTLVNGFKAEEITKIKNQYISSKIYERESIESYAFSLGHGFAQSGNIFCEDEFIEKIRAASTDEVWDGLQKVMRQSSHFTLQVPKGTKMEPLEKEIKKWQAELKKSATKTKSKFSKIKQITSTHDSAVKVVEIKPGIKLIYRQNKLTPTFVMHAYMKGGQSIENTKNAGIHHLSSRLLTYGYKGMGYEKLKNELESLSSSLNGFSGKNAYGMTLHGQTKDFERLSHHFFGTLFTPEIPKKFFDHEKKVILRALDNQKEDAMKQAFKAFYRMVFHQHAYSLDLAGTPETIKTFSPAGLQKLHAGLLKNSEIIFTYCGDLDFSVVHHHFVEAAKNLKSRTPGKKTLKKAKGVTGKREQLEFKREQTQIVIGAPAYPIGNKEDLYLKMITAHLSGQSSDLFVDVRDRKGLCYSVSPIHVSALEAGCWGIYIGSGHDKTKAAIDAILGILNNLRDHGIKREEFERIKTMIDGQNLLGIQTNEDYAQFYSIPVLHGLGLDFPHKNNDQIREAKYEDFQAFLKKFFSKKWNIVEAGRKD
ncbi:M16 family metallopeptidase [Peredibacter sp. HCB2-198]|uniref:M16 family metallopeptidase n=1 Tax=Peredibacter sp. HCB2-198 TaxID=3383025 RepID=UPI0038B46782